MRARIAIAVLVVSAVVPAVRAQPCLRVVVPSYFRGAAAWTRAADPPGVATMVLNPASGPGPAPDADYRARAASAREAGVRVLGYVDTAHGARDIATVRTEIDAYRAWYGVDGFFLDRASPDSADLPYYRDVKRYARGFLALNPGRDTARGYMDVSNLVVTFEGTPSTQATLRAPAWTRAYPPSRFAHLVYGASGRRLRSVLLRARAQGAGTVYVTDDAEPNPWDRLPAYWDTELRSLCS